jgi:hypothetical protein
MDRQALLDLFDREQRIEIEYPGMSKDVLPGQVVRFVRPAPGMSFVLYSRLDETNADAAIETEIEYFRGVGQNFEWKTYAHDTPPDLGERLLAHGFERFETDTVMVLDLRDADGSLLAPIPGDVRRVERREDLGAVKDVLAQVWGANFDWVDDRLGGHLEIPGFLNVYVAWTEGKAACAGWIYFHPHSQFASLWAGSTVKEYRRRGLYTAVLAARAQEALKRGYRYLVIDAGPESRPIVERHGFRPLIETTSYEWKP